MKATLEVINRMQAEEIIGKYAIGGAVERPSISSHAQRWILTYLFR